MFHINFKSERAICAQVTVHCRHLSQKASSKTQYMYYLPVSHSQDRALAHYIITSPLLYPERLKPGLPIHLYVVVSLWRFFKTTCKNS